MSVIGLRFVSLEGRREQASGGPQIKVNSVPKIKEVKEITLPALEKKALAVGFEFATDYDPKVGTIRLSGEVYYSSERDKQALRSWKSKKELPEEMRVEIVNHLFRSCLLKTATMADDLQLPPPMAIPRVKAREGK